MTLLLDEIRTYLVARNVVGAPTWPIYEAELPDDQDQMVSIFDGSGYPSDTLGRENLRGSLQTRVRCKRWEYPVGRTKCDDIFAVLQDAQANSGGAGLLPGFVYIQALSETPYVFNDAEGRPNFTLNFKWLRIKS